MYTLRKITGSGVQMNICLGKHYNLVEGTSAPEEFERCFQHFFKGAIEFDKNNEGNVLNKEYVEEMRRAVYAFVSDELGNEITPLYISQRNYIMTENGATFSNLTHK